MKKHFFLLVFIPFLLSKTCFGDIIIGNTHYIKKCVKITNMDAYPDISLLGFVPPSAMHYDTYLISSSDCLTKGYKFNDFNVYAVSKAYLAEKDIKTLDLPRDPNAIPANIHIELYGGYVHDSIPISGIDQYYKIVGFSNTSVVLYKWKEVTRFNDGRAEITTIYNYDGEVSQLSQKLMVGNSTLQNRPGIDVYPNPGQTNFHVRINSNYLGTVPLEIVTMGGKVVKSMTLNKTGLILDNDMPVENMRKGTYLVNLKFGKNLESKKIIIK